LCFNSFLNQTQQQFLQAGCDNCDAVLQLKGSAQNILDFTTPNFFG
jgi:hypothetical protein